MDDDEEFSLDDMALLEKHIMSTSGEKILQLMQDLPQLHSSDLIMKIASLLLSSTSGTTPKVRHTIEERGSELSSLQFPPKNKDAPFIDITAIMDPLSVGAQKLTPLLIVLQEVQVITFCKVKSIQLMTFLLLGAQLSRSSFYELC